MATTLVIKNADFSVNKLATVTFGDNVPCTALSLSDATKTLSATGDSYTLTATPTPANTTDIVSWGSSDSDTVSVENGVITALKVGSATITATCGSQTATCEVTVNVVPNFVAVGGFNPCKSGGGENAIVNNSTTSSNAGKNAIIAGNSSDTNVKTVDRSGSNVGDFRFVPVPIPTGAKKIKVESKYYKNDTLLSIKTRFIWFDSAATAPGYSGAKALAGVTGTSDWDQDEFVTSYTATIPDTTDIDSFAIGILMSDWSVVYNTDHAASFEVSFLAS